jgi:hypothetical protein
MYPLKSEPDLKNIEVFSVVKRDDVKDGEFWF